VIADNASAEDIGGWVASLAEPRIVYRRSDEPLPVTANWNAALDASTGEQVIMLGDDDALLPGFLAAIAGHAARPGGPPDLIYTGAQLFTYPGVSARQPEGSVAPYGYAEFLRGLDAPRTLAHEEAVGLVRDAMRFKLRFGFNMQFATLSRRLVDALRAYGPVFQSPFPDYYAMCAAFLEAREIVADPRPLVAIGVTPKSYGFFHENRREAEGMAFLDPGMRQEVPARLRDRMLPGSNINNGWLLAMDRLGERLGARHGLRLNVRRYRLLQAMSVQRDRLLSGAEDATAVRDLNARLAPGERVLSGAVGAAVRAAGLVPAPARRRLVRRAGALVGQFPDWDAQRDEASYANVLELFEALARERG
jgi:glycosyltransferase involved in cell wall biosynthesis